MANGPPTELPGTVVLPPQTALQLGGQSLNQITAALGAQPLMLTVVLLNLVFIGVAGYFMLQLEAYRAANLTALIDLMRSCVLETAPLARDSDKTVDELRRELDQMRQDERARDQRSSNEPLPPYVTGGTP